MNMTTMTKSQVLEKIRNVGLVPVLRARSADEAIAIAGAVEAGGVPVLEVTMTVPGAIEVIRQITHHSSGRVLVGAGTVLDPETARACMLAGAQFIVSPSLNTKTIEICRRYGVAVFPGGLTPTEIVTAWEAGADAVKVFPCSAVGGAQYLKALKAPLPQIELIPTGGVSLATAAEFLAAGAFALGVGGDLINNDAIAQGKPELITENAKKYLQIVQKARENR
ncbi:MAG: bifunctional 4-hydroxy-2-oxoglutarate aldolase/2-dehydro-3-deoxy-phosphogluconate aldolase [Candidatus Acidiferrum sp.]